MFSVFWGHAWSLYYGFNFRRALHLISNVYLCSLCCPSADEEHVLCVCVKKQLVSTGLDISSIGITHTHIYLALLDGRRRVLYDPLARLGLPPPLLLLLLLLVSLFACVHV